MAQPSCINTVIIVGSVNNCFCVLCIGQVQLMMMSGVLLSFSTRGKNIRTQEILLNCDQSNVGLLFARIIFFCILLRAFSFLSASILETRRLIETRFIFY